MFRLHRPLLAIAGLCLTINTHAQFATTVVQYFPGTGFAPGFTNATTALNEPSRVSPGIFGGPIDPFAPAFSTSQLVSLGAGGSLTVGFNKPILNHPRNRFGIDFIIFGNTGFIITNAFDPNTFEWIGEPATDGSLFAHNAGSTRVLVSHDGDRYYELDPAFAPTVDSLLPTNGAGDFHTPADPTLEQADFAGLPLAGIRALYYGSGGGTGYDISWARDAQGTAVWLPQINYVRVEVLTGKSEVDGFASVFSPPGWD